MANWAALQEQLVGKPVFKRAKHGIHFQNNDGSITANFSGKPCHFQDNGIWKPIDTALLATPDGWYSSPHSDVVIHPDGRVRVKGSDYQQFTKLPSAKKGVLDGDKIVRTFPGGEQHLIMKEDGFREEIHVFKPKFPIEKFIAKTTGNIPSHYKLHPITAEDAEGNTYEFTGDVKEFGAWLDGASYPVVIDPDFAGGTGDGIIQGTNANYATARATASAASFIGRTDNVGQYFSGTTYYCFRLFFLFDTSSIDDAATVTQSNLKFVCTIDQSTVDFDVQIVKQIWTGSNESNYDGCLSGNSDDSIWRNTSGLSVNTQYTSGNLSTAWVNKTGTTYYSLRSNNDFSGTPPNTNRETIKIAFANHDNESYRPVLTVAYSSGGIPKHFMHYQRLRG